MLRFIVIIMVVTGLASCKGGTSEVFTVSGVVKNKPATKIYLQETPLGSGQALVSDSAILGQDGTFTLKTAKKEETLYGLLLNGEQYSFLPIVNDVAKITVTADFKNPNDIAKTEGSPATESIKEFLNSSGERWNRVNVIGKEIDSIVKSGSPDSALTTNLNNQGRVAMEDFRIYVSQFVKKSKSPVVAAFALGSYGRLFSIEEYGNFLSEIVKKFPDHKAVALAKKEFDGEVAKQAQQQQQQQSSAIQWTGKIAPDFSLPDANGKEIKLSSFKGKFVLVDFWASWCGPCRGENPNIVAAYNKFKNKNFTILGVSLDRTKESWEEAIKKDGLTWTHVSDLKFWQSSIVPIYNLEGIPFNILVDPTGKIIAEGLRGPALEDKLQSVLN